MSDTDSRSRFQSTGLTVHFIYSFALAKASDFEYEPLDASELVGVAENRLLAGTPPERRGIKQHLALTERIASRAHEAISADVIARDESGNPDRSRPVCRVEIVPLVRLFRSAATCTFRVRLRESAGRSISLETIHAILRLVQQTESEPTPSLLQVPAAEPELKTLHDLFVQYVRACTELRGPEGGNVVWLDETKGYLRLTEKSGVSESQSPWVVTIAEVTGETEKAFCGAGEHGQDPALEKASRVKKYESEVAAILFRSVKGLDFSLEPGYVDRRTSGWLPGLHTLNLDSRLYVTMCNRSLLCICRDETTEAAAYFLPDLLDLSETLRARWHMLTIMNRCLDEVLTQLESRELTAEQKMRLVVSSRRFLSRLLEDPELYRVAGDALANISVSLKDIFRENALRRLLFEKAEFVEHIRAGLGELDWLSLEARYRSGQRR